MHEMWPRRATESGEQRYSLWCLLAAYGQSQPYLQEHVEGKTQDD